jgi:hypothetical protein
MRMSVWALVSTVLVVTAWIKPCCAEEPSEVSPSGLAALDKFQAALYSDCIMTGSAGELPAVNKASELSATKDQSQLNKTAMTQFKSLTALQGLTPVQLGCLTQETLLDYAHQTFGHGHHSSQALTIFLTQNAGSCLRIASTYTPANPDTITASCHLP